MATEDVANGEGIVVDKPERGAKEGYLGSFNTSRQQMGRVIVESNGLADHRIRLYTLHMISGITDDTIRRNTFNYFNQEIKKIRDKHLSAEEENQQIADFCCGDMQGHIVAWYDQFMGITHRLKMGGV